jgi:hypothetical protein
VLDALNVTQEGEEGHISLAGLRRVVEQAEAGGAPGVMAASPVSVAVSTASSGGGSSSSSSSGGGGGNEGASADKTKIHMM